MKYFIYIKKIKIFSILSVFFPLLTLGVCVVLYSFFGTISLSLPKSVLDFEKEILFVEWNHKTPDTTIFGLTKSFTNCSKFELEADPYTVLKDGTKIIRNQKNIDGIIKENIKNNNTIGFLYKRKTTINKSCIKNYPSLNKILIKSPALEKILVKIKLDNKTGFSPIKNPFIYGEVSISRTARYFPANIIFKSLIMLTAIFLIIYWINNFRVINLINLNFKKKYKSFLFFGLLSAIFLILHAFFLDLKFDGVLYKIFRRLVIIFFIIFEVTAQILLTRSLYLSKNNLKELINIPVLNIKIVFVTIIFIATIISFTILVFFDPSTAFKHALEWNYFCFLLLYYILSYLLWKKSKTLAHTPEGA